MAKEHVSRNWIVALRPEQEILLLCARAQTDSAVKDRIRVLVRAGLHWPDVLANAIRHRSLPVVYAGISATSQDLIPCDQLLELHEAARASAAHSLVLLREFLSLYELFEAARIPVIPYKGPVLAWVGYGSLTGRDYGDLDFAVQQKYIPDAAAVLKSAGYSAQFDPAELHAGQGGIAPGQYSFVSGSPEFLVELHTERTLRYFPTPLDFRDLTSRLIHVEIAGRRLRTFSIEDTLVMLCVHGAKHFWERLIWVLDVAQLITVRDIDWVLLFDIAKKMKSSRVLLLGLDLAHELFVASLPLPVLEEIAGNRTVGKLAQKVYEQYAGLSGPGAGVWPRAAFRFQSRDGVGQGLNHMMRLTVGPTESDRQAVRLPPLLAPFYMLVRPWRLMREYGWGLKRRVKPDLAVYEPALSEKTVEETQSPNLPASELQESNKPER